MGTRGVLTLWLLAGFGCVIAAWFLRPVIVGGGSMSPTLVQGDVCVIVRGLSVREGDVVLFRSPTHGAVLHRAVSVDPSGSLVTKGDANPAADRLAVSQSDLVGRCMLVIPSGKALHGWMRMSRGATLLNQSHSTR